MIIRLRNSILSVLSLACSMNVTADDIHQYCNPAIHPTAPDSRYRILGEGHEVMDLRTRLVWQRCDMGQTWDGAVCQGRSTFVTLPDAQAAAIRLSQGWRVPEIRELQTLVEYACAEPSRNLRMFPLDRYGNLGYWSVTPVSSQRRHVWGVDFHDGNSTPESADNAIPRTRLVRGPVKYQP
ncbi:MAG: DUF1566 domain-containing protein [Fluviicoccus sp.]|uniref:Lcl C-terminal domain-containing protein n=1 Tax=Fluviicoccus sp. TaxID=2003552 RepID=UPI0027164C01|nr:DUF1566 domain-containing protein [Fluviicoccus sp.]MDO8329637.1 DUF1566 domain-containing protein [Fluviicoccus sp.]